MLMTEYFHGHFISSSRDDAMRSPDATLSRRCRQRRPLYAFIRRGHERIFPQHEIDMRALLSLADIDASYFAMPSARVNAHAAAQ